MIQFHLKNLSSFLKSLSFLLFAFGVIFIPKASAQFTITENFKGSSVGSNIVLGDRGANTSQHAYLTSGNVDPTNEGWLRLTEAWGNRAGYAYINTPFPATLGVYIEFEYKAWRNRKDDQHHGADGFSVFLFDATVPFRIGGYGGSLGYANHNGDGGQQGLAGAYLGIGIDEYGNFATPNDGRNGGVEGVRPNSITLRGPESTNWEYLEHVQLQTSPSQNGSNSVDYNTVTGMRPNDDTFYRKVKVVIEPIGTDGIPKYLITVDWTTAPNGDDRRLLTYETEHPIPESLKLGFAASTGGGFNFHEIRNLLITTPGGVRVQKSVDKDNVTPDQELTYTVTVHNETTAALKNLVFADTIKLANGSVVNAEDFQVTSITFNNNGNSGNTAEGFTSGSPKTTGLTNPFFTTMNMAANSTATFTVKGTVKRVPAGGVIVNSVGIDPSESGITDTDLTNNYASVSTTVLNPNVDLNIEKGVDNNGVARTEGNTFSITVSNVSNVDKPGDIPVIVTDVIPDGLTVTNYTGKGGADGLPANGWSVSWTGNTYTFTRSDALEAIRSYPPILFEVTPNGTGPWVNVATVVYDPDTNPDNNSSSATLRWRNYWYGGVQGKENAWSEPGNWTANMVPVAGENIEFATVANNGAAGQGNGKGAAVSDLYLDDVNQDNSGGRIIGDLINDSDQNLVVATGNQLKINGTVKVSTGDGTIIVRADPTDQTPSGTLIFAQPANNQSVEVTVEFYNRAYDCETCGFYRRSWQYFGVPVKEADFPYNDVDGEETVNQWVEPFNGNKWRPAPYTPDEKLTAFKGYQITNDITTKPTKVYGFEGRLYVGDAGVDLTKTDDVNYTGVNLVGNSYTAAIPINANALVFPDEFDQTVYLFNAGTRDQWRKLNGTAINQDGYRSGQYLAVPLNLGGTDPFPDRIPSMHAFMVLFPDTHAPTTTGSLPELGIKYNRLMKNTTVDRGDGTQIVTRSAGTSTETDTDKSSSTSTIPSLVMDVIGEESADRVWVFAKEGTTHGFDNGWDGRKMGESGIAQLYVVGSDESRLQVATVPTMEDVTLGFVADKEGTYSLEFSLSGQLNTKEIFLHDVVSGKRQRLSDGGAYSFQASEGDPVNRFRLTSANNCSLLSDDEGLIDVSATGEGKIVIRNGSAKAVSVAVSALSGELIYKEEVPANSEIVTSNIGSGIYIVRLQNAQVNDVRKVIIK